MLHGCMAWHARIWLVIHVNKHSLHVGWRNICKLPWFLQESSVSCYLLCYSSRLGRRLQSALFADLFFCARWIQTKRADYHFTFYLPYYSEGTDDAQKTPRGHPDFNSYVKIQRVFIDRTDRITDGETNTLAARGLEEHMRITLIFARIISFMLFTVLLLLRPPLTIGTFCGFIFLRSLNSNKTCRLPFYILPALLFGGDRRRTENSTWTPWF